MLRNVSALGRPSRKVLLLATSALVVLVAAIFFLLPNAKSNDPGARAQSSKSGRPPKASNPIPDRAIKVVGGRLGRYSTWGIWLFGGPNGNCWATKTTTRRTPFEEAYCGYSVPPAYSQLAASGPVARDDGPRSMVFFLTRRDVSRLTVLITRGRKDQADVSVEMRTRFLSPGQIKQTRMRPNFGYATAVFSGSSYCVKRVDSFNESGELIDRTSLACTPTRNSIEENFE